MWKSTPVEILSAEAGLEPANIILTRRQQRFSSRLANLPDGNPAKIVLPVTFRQDDGDAQPDEQLDDDTVWASIRLRSKENLGQYLARSLFLIIIIDLVEGIEIIESTHPSLFPGVIIMDLPLQALEAAKKY